MSAPTASRRRLLLAALLFGAAWPAFAEAQQCRGAGSWRRIDSISPANLIFSSPAIVDYDSQGIVYGSLVTITVTSQRQGSTPLPWTLCVGAETPTLGTSQGATKPLSDLQIDPGGGNWLPVTAGDQQISAGDGNTVVQLRVRVRLSWDDDPPGSFGTLLRFTVGS